MRISRLFLGLIVLSASVMPAETALMLHGLSDALALSADVSSEYKLASFLVRAEEEEGVQAFVKKEALWISRANRLYLEAIVLPKIRSSLPNIFMVCADECDFGDGAYLSEFLGKFTELGYLRLNDCGLTSFDSGCLRDRGEGLQMLDLASNSLSRIALASAQSLRHLDLSHNQLTSFEHVWMGRGLQYISLAANPLAALPDDFF